MGRISAEPLFAPFGSADAAALRDVPVLATGPGQKTYVESVVEGGQRGASGCSGSPAGCGGGWAPYMYRGMTCPAATARVGEEAEPVRAWSWDVGG